MMLTVKMSGYSKNPDVIKECTYPTRIHSTGVEGQRFKVLEINGIVDTKEKFEWIYYSVLQNMHGKLARESEVI